MQVCTSACGHTVVIASESGQAVADRDADVGGTPVLDLGEHREPVPRDLATDAGADSEHVAAAIDGDADDDVEGPVGDLTVADLDLDRVDEDHRVDGLSSVGGCERSRTESSCPATRRTRCRPRWRSATSS